jgi:hypothetical protein
MNECKAAEALAQRLFGSNMEESHKVIDLRKNKAINCRGSQKEAYPSL